MQFLDIKISTNRDDVLKLLLGIFHYYYSKYTANVRIIKDIRKEDTLNYIKVSSINDFNVDFKNNGVPVQV